MLGLLANPGTGTILVAFCDHAMLLNWPQLQDSFQSDFGSSFRIEEASPIQGGDINLAFRLETSQGTFFAKLNTPDMIDLFESEREGLMELAACDALEIPEPILCGKNAGAAFLCMSWLDLSEETDQAGLGEAIAALHQPMGQDFGWSSNNFIGASIQHNDQTQDWPEFFWSMRIEPQLMRMIEAGPSFSESAMDPIQAKVLHVLRQHTYVASLVHGDLWIGNAATTLEGRPCIYDPAVHWGHAETDLAMARLFGGFGEAFFDAYEVSLPRETGADERMLIYQLYHLLNHYNLFGASYLDRCIKQIGAIMAL